jgi:peptidoglycan/xylan/chitin deacetylase (PgdA/CDA1 family)
MGTTGSAMAQGDNSSHAGPLVLSVVVFGYGNEDSVVRSLASVVDQGSGDRFEVLVVTCGGQRTAQFVGRHNPKVRLIEVGVGLMPGAMRNIGIEAASGEFVAFLEVGCIARAGWVEYVIESHRAGHEAVASAVVVANPRNKVARANAYIRFPEQLEGAVRGPLATPRPDGLSYTRGLLDRVGPFEETVWVGEDPFMARRLSAARVEPWFEPSARIELADPSGTGTFVREAAVIGRRQARTDIVLTTSGFLRSELEAHAPRLTVGLRATRRGLRQGVRTATLLARRAPSRREVLATLPWIMLGLAANTIGWIREQKAYARTGTFTEDVGVGPTRAPLRRVTTTNGTKTLVLTFDDGPSEYTSRLLQVLAEHHVPATFFVLGDKAKAMPDLMRAITEGGHDVASHGWSHTAFTELHADELSSEIRRTSDTIRALTGTDCKDVRPPYGRYDAKVVNWLARHDLVTWLWTAEAHDYEPSASVDRIVRNTLGSLSPGGIVLLHDGGGDRSRTVQALPRIIEGAQNRGYRFIALRDVRASLRPIADERT